MPVGSVLTDWSVNLGSHVSSGTALASVVSPSRLSATALISQADIAELKVGQKAQMTIDGYTSDAFTGRISFIANEPASSSSHVRLVELHRVLNHREPQTCPARPSQA